MNLNYRDTLHNFLKTHSAFQEDSPIILIWELGGFDLILKKNSIIAAALNVRGFNTHTVICDGTPVACIQREIQQKEKLEDWEKRCNQCILKMRWMAEECGQNYSMAGDYISTEKMQVLQDLSESIHLKEILNYRHLELPVGEFAWSSFNRYLKGYSSEIKSLSPELVAIYRKYFYAALINIYIASKVIKLLMNQSNLVSLLTSHGVHADYAPAVFCAVKNNIKAVSWTSGYADFLHYFTIPKSADQLLLRGIKSSRWQNRSEIPLTETENKRLDVFTHERYRNNTARDILIVAKPATKSSLKEQIGIGNEKPIICLFTHVNWDASFDLPSKIFPTANTWVIESIKKMLELIEVNWIIRIHPAELTHECVASAGDIIKKNFPLLPDHIKILWADSDINSYGLYQLIDGAITMFGTVGVEMSTLGKPVIVAGEAHYTGKGFTLDADSPAKYFSLLENAKNIRPLTDEQKNTAMQYAYSYFIQRQIPFEIIDKKQGHWGNIDLEKIDMLLPGNDPIIDLVCDRIIDGEDFIMEEDILSSLYPVSVLKEKENNTDSPSKLLGFDPNGEVFEYKGRILRGIFNGTGNACQKTLEACFKYNLFDAGIVKTHMVNGNELSKFGYDIVLEHEKIPFITYAHEWPSEMIKDAALFQLDLNLKLNSLGITLKDCGVTGNVLFNSTRPVFVDFLSLVFENELAKEDWLAPSVIRTPFQPLWSNKSAYFNEIFYRMFYPYTLFPLYMMHQGRFSETRWRMLKTTLNTCSESITEKEAMANADFDLHGFQQRALAAREYALVNDDWSRFLGILSKELEQLNVSVDQSNYSGYYEQKGENFGFEPSEDWLPKQRAMYNALLELRPGSVLDIGSNTGWFSILAAKAGCRVVAMDNDEASMNRLYKKSKREGLPIMPLVMDILHPTPDVPPSPNLATDPHMVNSRIKGDALILQSANKRLKCDMVLALAIIHHLTLGKGLGLRKAVELLSSFSKKYLVVEFVPKDDPLIAEEMDFFPAFNQNPLGFEWYTKENWLRELSGRYKTIDEKGRQGNRLIFVCSEKK